MRKLKEENSHSSCQYKQLSLVEAWDQIEPLEVSVACSEGFRFNVPNRSLPSPSSWERKDSTLSSKGPISPKCSMSSCNQVNRKTKFPNTQTWYSAWSTPLVWHKTACFVPSQKGLHKLIGLKTKLLISLHVDSLSLYFFWFLICLVFSNKITAYQVGYPFIIYIPAGSLMMHGHLFHQNHTPSNL